jgi:peptide chain release factor 1
MFYDEISSLKQQIENEIEEIKVLLLPKDANDESNVIIEIRQAAGGEESALFCNELYRMYCMYAEKKRWKVEVMDINETELGGIKEITFMVKGKGAYSRFKFESGVHRVQRVPETESQGRIHTSTSTVAVLPEIEEVEFEIEEKDLRIDTYRSSGAGGQHINKTESAIRITHLPTGIVVACQDERSQMKNKEKAMSILRSKLYDYYQGQIDSEYKENRKSQVGSGDRSERVRTYNYPQGRVTDHRVNVTSYSLDNVLNGDIDLFIDALILKDRTEKLANA